MHTGQLVFCSATEKPSEDAEAARNGAVGGVGGDGGEGGESSSATDAQEQQQPPQPQQQQQQQQSQQQPLRRRNSLGRRQTTTPRPFKFATTGRGTDREPTAEDLKPAKGERECKSARNSSNQAVGSLRRSKTAQSDRRTHDVHVTAKRLGRVKSKKDEIDHEFDNENWEPRNGHQRQGGKCLTVPRTPRFSSDARILYRKQVLNPQKKMKEEEQRKKREEEERRRQQEDAKNLAEYRKSLIHKPRPVPDFGNVFKPDFSRSAPTTKPVNVRFAMDARLGPKHIASPRSDTSSPSGDFRCNPHVCADAYKASLRRPYVTAPPGNTEDKSLSS